MGLFDIFKKKEGRVEIFSKRPVAKFKVEKVFEIFGNEVLVGEVVEGVIYPGYKVKGKKAALIREIQKERQKVDFALEYDKVALVLEGKLNTKAGEVLEVYQS
ncbi:Translation factor [Thermococcus litoralis DSM 5473]|uniref:Translation factor n=1 Tax=Thermococcus litoralis (strain ATCC 51850 / DSM 5473 / JCM 8560 / NS-C) TaxID=523849 RepID=H3ZQ38_THELN|nr:tRNA-binding protein Pbp11 [Thermococcus litoralis]EHR77929.1 Translation factor [Thermococcus litoralis DSM 5473]